MTGPGDLYAARRAALIEREAERMAIAAEFGVSEWEAFVNLAEERLILEGRIYEWRYRARRAPGTERPSVWVQSTGQETRRVSDHRTMLGARARAWRLNGFHEGWREAIRDDSEQAMVA